MKWFKCQNKENRVLTFKQDRIIVIYPKGYSLYCKHKYKINHQVEQTADYTDDADDRNKLNITNYTSWFLLMPTRKRKKKSVCYGMNYAWKSERTCTQIQ